VLFISDVHEIVERLIDKYGVNIPQDDELDVEEPAEDEAELVEV
jgi:hypothetical protein